MIRRAAEFATRAHAGAYRKGSRIPYIYHPMEAALIVREMTDDEELIAAAYLHDVLEDTSVTAEELRLAFGERVLRLVLADTEDKSLSWHERKGNTIRDLKDAPSDVKILMLGDKLSNMRSTARDYMAAGESVWLRFNEKRKECHQWYARGIMESLSDLEDYPAYQEYRRLYEFVFGA